ncbi:MAG: hypothetical protein LAT54_10385 [Cryomorphaceae bacterium]|nr:hypothetical protein [Cryomorphaceae bacterium]
MVWLNVPLEQSFSALRGFSFSTAELQRTQSTLRALCVFAVNIAHREKTKRCIFFPPQSRKVHKATSAFSAPLR